MGCDELSGRHGMLCTASCSSEGTIVLPYKQGGHYLASRIRCGSQISSAWRLGWQGAEVNCSGNHCEKGSTAITAHTWPPHLTSVKSGNNSPIPPYSSSTVDRFTCRVGIFNKMLKITMWFFTIQACKASFWEPGIQTSFLLDLRTGNNNFS